MNYGTSQKCTSAQPFAPRRGARRADVCGFAGRLRIRAGLYHTNATSAHRAAQKSEGWHQASPRLANRMREMIHDSITQPSITRKIPSASAVCTRYHGRNAVSISTRYTSGMDNLNFIAIRISKSSMEKQAVNMNNPPQTVCRMLTLLLQFYKYYFENQIREVVMNQTTKPAACPDSVRVERIQISHGRAIRVVSVFPKSGSQTAEEKLRVLAALELQRKKSA